MIGGANRTYLTGKLKPKFTILGSAETDEVKE